ncbi:phage protein NinX family protein [Enterobacter ludwigii]|uniref:phage protein NinX family protein n=1 Tax=Enterobacter ludwigii TaxID=299767 RepID=UPI0037543155
MDYTELSDFEINNLVAISLGAKVTDSYRAGEERETVYYSLGSDEFAIRRGFGNINDDFDPCQKPSDAWPIIADNRISIMFDGTLPEHEGEYHEWCDAISSCQNFGIQHQLNPLRAAMIVFLMMQESANVPANSTGSDLR